MRQAFNAYEGEQYAVSSHIGPLQRARNYFRGLIFHAYEREQYIVSSHYVSLQQLVIVSDVPGNNF